MAYLVELEPPQIVAGSYDPIVYQIYDTNAPTNDTYVYACRITIDGLVFATLTQFQNTNGRAGS